MVLSSRNLTSSMKIHLCTKSQRAFLDYPKIVLLARFHTSQNYDTQERVIQFRGAWLPHPALYVPIECSYLMFGSTMILPSSSSWYFCMISEKIISHTASLRPLICPCRCEYLEICCSLMYCVTGVQQPYQGTSSRLMRVKFLFLFNLCGSVTFHML
jgi:hypothetical protein